MLSGCVPSSTSTNTEHPFAKPFGNVVLCLSKHASFHILLVLFHNRITPVPHAGLDHSLLLVQDLARLVVALEVVIVRLNVCTLRLQHIECHRLATLVSHCLFGAQTNYLPRV